MDCINIVFETILEFRPCLVFASEDIRFDIFRSRKFPLALLVVGAPFFDFGGSSSELLDFCVGSFVNGPYFRYFRKGS